MFSSSIGSENRNAASFTWRSSAATHVGNWHALRPILYYSRIQRQSARFLKDNPRIKNLVYILGGGAIGTLLDWQLFAKTNTEVSKLELALHFAIAAVSVILLGFIVLSILVAI